MGREEKQFALTSKENCCIYLVRIISSCELCMDRLKIYNLQLKMLVDKYKGKDVVPWEIYIEIMDKSYNNLSYLLNLLGDCQNSSISYFKYRKQIEKRVKKGNIDIPLYPISDEISELLENFNKMRNWVNHVPESLLVAELELLDSKIAEFLTDSVKIYHHKYVTFEYFEHLYLSNVEFYTDARKIIQTAKKEYTMLHGKSVNYPRVYIDRPIGKEKSQAAKKSLKVQGIQVKEE